MLIAILVTAAVSLGVQVTFIGIFAGAMIAEHKEKKEAQKRASEKKEKFTK